MKIPDIKCPNCNSNLTDIEIEKVSIKDEKEMEDEKIICLTNDVVFLKGFCEKCNQKIKSMATIDINISKIYSASNRSQLVMLKNEKYD